MAKKRKEADRTRKELNGLKVELKWNGHGKELTPSTTFPPWLALITLLERSEKEWKEMETPKRKDNGKKWKQNWNGNG